MCKTEEIKKPIRWDIDKVRHFVEVESGSGCKLKSEKYTNSKTKLEFQCSCGEVFTRTFDTFRRNKSYRCGQCIGKITWDFERVKNYVENEDPNGCSLLSETYINNRTPLKFRCKCGSPFSKNFDYFRSSEVNSCEECSGIIRWDIDKVKYFVEVESQSGCKLISKTFKNVMTNLDFKCKCGTNFSRNFNSFKDKKLYECEKCNSYIRWDINKVRQFVENESNSACKLISTKYINMHSILDFQCSCGEKFSRNFNNFISYKAYRCEACNNYTNWDIDKLRRYVEVESNSGCKLISKEYVNTTSNMRFECHCGNPFERAFTVFKNQKAFYCNECSKSKRNRLTYEKIKHFVEVESNSGCKLLSEEFIGSDYDLKFKCACGRPFSRKFYNFKFHKQYECGRCLGKMAWDLGTVKHFVEIESDSRCKLISTEYTGVHDKLIFKCPCGEVFKRDFNSFRRLEAYACYSCSSKKSKGEKIIADFFNDILVKYKEQDTHTNLTGLFNRSLRFDFLVHDDINNHTFSIEYDGEQHFFPVDFAGKGEKWAVDRHTDCVFRDKIKNQYCINSNIPLLRIPYWEFDNIEDILESALMHFNIIERGDAYALSKFEQYLVDKDWDHDEYLSKCPKQGKHINDNE